MEQYKGDNFGGNVAATSLHFRGWGIWKYRDNTENQDNFGLNNREVKFSYRYILMCKSEQHSPLYHRLLIDKLEVI